MSASFPCEIRSFNSSLYKGDATQVILPTQEGEVCLLPEHIHYLSLLKEGQVIVNKMVIPIKHGYVHFENNHCQIWVLD